MPISLFKAFNLLIFNIDFSPKLTTLSFTRLAPNKLIVPSEKSKQSFTIFLHEIFPIFKRKNLNQVHLILYPES